MTAKTTIKWHIDLRYSRFVVTSSPSTRSTLCISMHIYILCKKGTLMNYPPYDPNDPHAQPTTAGQYPQWGQSGQPSSPQWGQPDPTTAGQYPQFSQPGQPSSPQWGQQQPPPPQFPQSGQFGAPPIQPKPPKPPLFDYKARKAYYKQYPLSKKQNLAIGCGTLIGILILCGICSAITTAGNSTQQPTTTSVSSPVAKKAQPTPKPLTTQERIMSLINGNSGDGSISQNIYSDSDQSVQTTLTIGMQWDNSSTVTAIESGCYDIQKSLWTANPSLGLQTVTVFVDGPVTDAYGKQSIAQVGFCNLKSATAAKFSWDNLDGQSAWSVYDNQGLAPFLQ